MSRRSPLLSRPGAVEGSGPDAGVAAHYGEPLPEQRRLEAGEAVADLSHRGVVTVAGPDRLGWLNTLSSQATTSLSPGASTEALFLNLQGRIEHDCRVVDDGATTWLVVERDEAAPLAAWLDSMRFMLRVEVADASAEWAVVGSARELPGLAGNTVWRDPWPGVSDGGYAYSTGGHPAAGRTWLEYLVPAAGLEDAVQGLPLAGTLAVEALRIAAWRPRMGVDTDEKTIPHELDLLRTAVHLSKGCYKGQETVARVHNLGHPPRRLVFLDLDGSLHTLPEPGSEVVLGGKVVGRLTSAALHHEAGPIALAVLKRSTDPDAELTVRSGDDSYPATQQIVVAPDAGQVVGRQQGFLRGPR
ncbi:YgfZ/GcvT domain-containing protein [Zafaria sp. Z1313]|uniref:CAF17-like 4Fe-4S cluster assembly/insertion protein YgfZ n=1 Tax=unclassified Zafaria TaxID=2828765 RepID=UPI002E75EAD0|nr:glycine cleavage T C-terminal barrel domain-containing protein [Zafaria sp. J156]MEE1620594.1 glycine cleavage T C-terminal barrel domain-containing protein [Zafaria sp. J156]